MARGSEPAQQQAQASRQFSGQLAGNATGIGSTLVPSLTAEALNPQGFGEKDLAEMNTAAQQSEGGAQAGAVGQGALLAQRTGNAGGPMAAIAEAARAGGRNLMDAALGTRIKNSMLKQDQRRAATAGLQDMYGMNVSGANQAASALASNVQADAAAKEASWGWSKHLFQPILRAATGGIIPGVGGRQ